MIDCRECRTLIDRDLTEPLDQPERTALTNHLRSCQNCVTYRKERLKDSSILRRSVDELKERAEEAPPPPPPPPRPAFWPWIVTAAVLVLAAFGIITLMQSGADDTGTVEPPVNRRPPSPTGASAPTPAAPDRRDRPTNARTPVKPDQPVKPLAARIRVHGLVRDAHRGVAGDAEVALVPFVSPDAECLVTRAGPDGSFVFETNGRFPVYVTAWKDASVSSPVRVDDDGKVTLVLGAGKRIVGEIRNDGGLDLSRARVVALWDDAGRSVSAPAPGGRFSLSLPADRPVELRPYRTGLKTYAFVPPIPLALAAGYDGPILLHAADAKLVVINLVGGGQPVHADPMLVAAIPSEGPPRRFSPVDGHPGTFHAALTRGVHRVAVWVRGFAEAGQQLTVDDGMFAHIALEKGGRSLTGVLRVDPPNAALPEEIVVRRDPPLFAGEPGIRAPVLGSGGRATFAIEGLPWSTVVVETGSKLEQRFGPYTLPQRDVTLTASTGASIQGTVKTAGGTVVPGVLVAAETPAGTTFTHTEKDGSYRFEGLPAGELFVYPRTAVARFESFAGLKDEFRVRLSPGAAIPVPLVLASDQPCSLLLRDENTRPVVGMVFLKTLKGALVSAFFTRPIDPTQPTASQPLPIPPVNPGAYLAEVSESGVFYLIGRVNLPGQLDLRVLRNRPRLTVKLSAPPAALRPDAPLRLSVTTLLGEPVGRLELPRPQSTELGGLDSGPYRIEAEWGGLRARGLVQVGSPGSPSVALELTLR